MREEILGEISWLKDDIHSCEAAMRSEVREEAKAEFQSRIRSDKKEIKRLEKQLKRC